MGECLVTQWPHGPKSLTVTESQVVHGLCCAKPPGYIGKETFIHLRKRTPTDQRGLLIAAQVIQWQSHQGEIPWVAQEELYYRKVPTLCLPFNLLCNFKERRDPRGSLEVHSSRESPLFLHGGVLTGSLLGGSQVWVVTDALFQDSSGCVPPRGQMSNHNGSVQRAKQGFLPHHSYDFKSYFITHKQHQINNTFYAGLLFSYSVNLVLMCCVTMLQQKEFPLLFKQENI